MLNVPDINLYVVRQETRIVFDLNERPGRFRVALRRLGPTWKFHGISAEAPNIFTAGHILRTLGVFGSEPTIEE